MDVIIGTFIPILCTLLMCMSNYLQMKNCRKENELFRSVIQKNTEAIMKLELAVDERGCDNGSSD